MDKSKKYLFKNIGFLTISKFGTSLLSFFLVPLYTYILTTEEYGTYDLYLTTVSLLVPILTKSIADAVLRFLMDKNVNKEKVISIGVEYFVISSLIVVGFVGINYCFNIIPYFNEYPIMFILLFVSYVLSALATSYCRGIDRMKEVAISGVVCTAALISLNILFLVVFKLGLMGYFLANIIGINAQNLYIFISTKPWKQFKFVKKDKALEKEMTEYSKPLLLNDISWWISASSDRYIITWLCGVGANGIYSVGYKIPSILSIFQSIFNQAWVLSAVKDYDKDDKNNFFSDMYKSYNFCILFICAGLIATTKISAYFLYSKDFYEAWKYVPFLLIAILFGSLSGYIGGIFSAVKDAKIYAKSSVIGAVVNICLNTILVYFIGPIGAAIATAICYIVIWAIRLISVKKYMTLHLNYLRDIFSYMLLLVQTVLLFVASNNLVLYIGQFIILIILLFIYRKEFFSIIKSLKGKLIG